MNWWLKSTYTSCFEAMGIEIEYDLVVNFKIAWIGVLGFDDNSYDIIRLLNCDLEIKVVLWSILISKLE